MDALGPPRMIDSIPAIQTETSSPWRPGKRCDSTECHWRLEPRGVRFSPEPDIDFPGPRMDWDEEEVVEVVASHFQGRPHHPVPEHSWRRVSVRHASLDG